jgi:hypothetical protein
MIIKQDVLKVAVLVAVGMQIAGAALANSEVNAAKQLGWKEITTKVVPQANSPLKIEEVAAFWEPVDGIGEQAYWLVYMTVRNVSRKPVIAYEIAVALWGPFNEQVGGFLGVSDPDTRLMPSAAKDANYRQVNVNESSGALVKVLIRRVKFSDGSIWNGR